MRILIVEDDFGSRIAIQKMLTPYSECEVAVNGNEAVEAFTNSFEAGVPYDLICMDIMMPQMNGKEALKIIREKEKSFNIAPRNEVKIVMITALDTAKDVIDAYYNGGCTSYLVKPILKENVLKMMQELKLIPDKIVPSAY
ncbi:MAG: response regulator [Ignavibacteriaceae bacterium]|jgi:two-component system chemotaxis response regulator CheY